MNQIYCLSSPSGIHKIGFTSGLQFRKRELERAQGCKLVTVFAIDIPFDLRAAAVEKIALRLLRPHLVQGREWFDVGADVIKAAVLTAIEEAFAKELTGLRRL